MAFSLKTWVNRISEYPNRRKLTHEDGSTELVTVARAEGQISAEGNAFSAEEMNDLENRIKGGFDEINQSLTDINKFTSTNTLGINQDIVMNYDAFIMFRITYGNAAYTGYTLTVNDVMRDACAAIAAVGEMTVTRSFEVKKGDKIRLDINTNTICHESKFYFK